MNKVFGYKIGTIVFLILALMIPLSMIMGVVSDRSTFRNQAQQSIAQSWTGTQKLLGPILAVPYSIRSEEEHWDENLKAYVKKDVFTHHTRYLLPKHLQIEGSIATENLKRGIYSIPVYATDLTVQGKFNNEEILQLIAKHSDKLMLKAPTVTLYISDIRGISEQPQLTWENNLIQFESGSGIDGWGNGMHAALGKLNDTQLAEYSFSFKVKLKGMESIQFSPVANSTEVTLSANWPHPKFIGRYLPVQRDITDDGFTAKWAMSSFSSDMPRMMENCQSGDCNEFLRNTFGVSLINSVDIYHKTERSVKYAILFITLTFTAFFLFEIMKGLRLHPMQYFLVGLSLTCFYLLLISLSEHMAFHFAYLSSAVVCLAVIGLYISEVLKSRSRALGFTGSLCLLYSMLYFILVSEDNALLMGSLLFFAILTLVMMVTRKLDWFQITDRLSSQAVIKDEPVIG